MIPRRLAGQRLDAAHAGADRALAQDMDEADVAGGVHMGAAAQFDGEGLAGLLAFLASAHGHDADLVAVFLAEQRHGARCDGVVHRHQPRLDRGVLQDDAVGQPLDLGEFGGLDGLGMREVEAQPLRRDHRALLGDMAAEDLAQALMQQMRRRMVGADLGAPAMIDDQVQRHARLHRARLHLAAMDEQPLGEFLRVGDDDLDAVAAHDAGVAELAARFAVERRLVEDDGHLVAGARCRDLGTVAHHRHDRALGPLGVVAKELRRADALADREPDRLGRGFTGTGPALARLGLLPLHGGVEGVEIDLDAALAQRILGQIQREAVGVVELEGGLAGQLGAGIHALGRVGQQRQAAVERLQEAPLLQLQRLGDQRLGAHQLGIGAAHLGDQRRQHLVEHRLACPEHLGVAHGPPHDAAQDIAAALVRRQHAVGDQEGGRAQVIGDDPVAGDAVTLGARADGRLDAGDQRLEQVDVVIVVDALQDRRDALQPHAGVDRRARQLDAIVGAELLELHEDEIPDLDEAVAILVRAARRTAGDALAMVEEDLRARAARAGLAHRPEIVGGRDADDAVVGQAGDLAPQRRRFLVLGIDRDQQPVGRQCEFLGDQVPGEFDRPVLEIVAEGEIAQHLEEGVVPGGIADIVEIVVLAAGAHAFLRGRGALIGPGLDAGEDVLELHHARIGEHQCRVVARHERRRGHPLVIVLREIVEERGPDFVDATHECDLRNTCGEKPVAAARTP